MKSEAEKRDSEMQELKKIIEQQRRDIEVLNEEIDAVKEQNSRAPTTTIKNLVERLKNQLALKEKQHQVRYYRHGNIQRAVEVRECSLSEPCFVLCMYSTYQMLEFC